MTCLPERVHKQEVAPVRVLPGLEGHCSINLGSTSNPEAHNALKKVSVGQDFGHAAEEYQRLSGLGANLGVSPVLVSSPSHGNFVHGVVLSWTVRAPLVNDYHTS